jgi:GDP-mannose 6-dehydrogenase
MTISVFGLGYVGCVAAASLARDGHTVIGVDVNPEKVALAASGRSPVIEPGLERLIRDVVKAGRLRATLDAQGAVTGSDVSIICVGTPGNHNGSLNLQYVKNVCHEIGAALSDTSDYHVVVVRSTVLPGTVEEHLVPLLEQQSGRRAGADFGVVMNPEFLREGTALDDYNRPPLVVIGELDSRSGAAVQCLYDACEAPVLRTTIRAAEMVKYASNAFHALKVAFANEIGTLCGAHAVDGQQLMEIFCQDRRLNISTAYLKPGFAFGGSCLPKDLRALLYRAKERDLECPLLSAVTNSNQQQIQRGIRRVEETGCRKIGVLGLSFKAGTDDVRESPVVSLVETLIGRGYQVSVYDDLVEPARLTGANKSFLEREIPHIAALMRPSIDAVIAEAEVVVVANRTAAFRAVHQSMRPGQALVDLVGVVETKRADHPIVKASPDEVSNSDSWRTSRRAALGWQSARSARTGSM